MEIDGTRDCGTFFLDVVGSFNRGDVTVVGSDRLRDSNDERVLPAIPRAKALRIRAGTPGPNTAYRAVSFRGGPNGQWRGTEP